MKIELNEEQKQASEILDSNLQIIACAGSGKTQVISLRIINLLKKGVEPKEIVAFTFTEKAAAELKHRVFELVNQDKEINNIGLAEIYIGTIHSWCLTKLKDTTYWCQKFEILDDIKLKLFVDRAYIKAGMQELNMKCYIDTNIFLNLMSLIRETQLKKDIPLPSNLIRAKEKYESYLKENHYFDFSMILTEFLNELNINTSNLHKYISSTIKYLIVDEYQDVNDIQEKIIYEIYKTNCNICVVGDDDQTIYHWRGSNIKNILNFTKNYNDVKIITLEKNYRSSNAIIDVATKIIEKIPNEERLSKKMNSKSHQVFEQGDLIKNNFETQEEEVNYIINTIKNIRGIEFKDKPNSEKRRGLDYSDMVILLRSWNIADAFAEGLKNTNIPYIVAGVNKLFEQDEIKACENIFKYLKKNISRNELKKSWISLSNKIDIQKLEDALKYLDNYDNLDNETWYEYLILQEVYRTFLNKLELTEKQFEDLYEFGMSKGEIVFYNLGKFSQIIQDFETIHFRDNPLRKLENFLNFLHYTASDYYPEGWLNQNLVTPNAVTIMTIHQSKGLEFPVVFIPGMNRNYFPIKKPGGKSIWHFFDKENIENPEKYDGSDTDERRLFYVAITRSKKFLFVTRSPKPTKNNLYKKESIFYENLRESEYIFQSKREFDDRIKVEPKSEAKINNIILNFSLLESYFDCPYKFKFNVLYGFNEPLSPRIGYGKSIHDSLMEIHKRSRDEEIPEATKLKEILERHLSFPYAIDKTKETMKEKALISITKYYNDYKQDFKNLEHIEKDIEIDFGNGIIVNGRIDLIKKKDLDGKPKTYIIDFKSKFDPNKDKISMKQLEIYALGYEKLTNEKADFLQIYDFDKGMPESKEVLDKDLINIEKEVINAANNIKNNNFKNKCNDIKCICHLH